MERADQEERLRAFAESTHQTELESIEIIEKLAQTVDAARLFVAVIVDQSFGPAELMSEITHGSLTAKFENLAYHLFPFFGASNERLITPWQTNECIEALERLFTFRGIGRSARPATLGPAERILEGVRRDARIVRGSAYPEQTAEEIVSIQGRFENWFAKANWDRSR